VVVDNNQRKLRLSYSLPGVDKGRCGQMQYRYSTVLIQLPPSDRNLDCCPPACFLLFYSKHRKNNRLVLTWIMQRHRALNPKMICSRCWVSDMTVGKSDKKAKLRDIRSSASGSLIYVINLDTVTVLCQVFGFLASRASLRRPYDMLPNWSYKRPLWFQASVTSPSLRRGRVLLNWF